MGAIYYGIHYFNKTLGTYGEKVACQSCGREYKKTYIKQSRWVHIDYIPLIPLTPSFFRICPVCGDGEQLEKAAAKEQTAAYGGSASELEPRITYSGSDKRYTFCYRDLATGEEICLGSNLQKGALKRLLKERGLKLKNIEIRQE